MAESRIINLVTSSEHVITPPDFGPIVQHGSRVIDIRAVDEETLERLLNSPLSENWLNRDKRRAAKAVKPVAAPAKPADEENPEGTGKKKN